MRQKGNFVVDTGVPPEDTYRQMDWRTVLRIFDSTPLFQRQVVRR